MNDKTPNPIAQMFAAMRAAEEKQKQAHAHADTFGVAIRDEVDNAKRAGACEGCIVGELLEAAAMALVAAAEGMPINKIEPLLQAAEADLRGYILKAFVTAEAKKLAGK